MNIMIKKEFCPVCNKRLLYNTVCDTMGIVEQNVSCNCGYYYEFAYGNYKEIIGKTAFVWNYRIYNNNNDFVRFFKKRKKVAFMAKRNYKKFHNSHLPVSYMLNWED